MDENIIELQMDEHLHNIQQEAKSALDRFALSKMNIDKKFINHFLKVTIDR